MVENKRTNERGITLTVLIITILVMLIIAGVSIGDGTNTRKQALEATLVSELNMVQHSALERYTKANLTKEELPGNKIELSEVQKIIDEINIKSGNSIVLKASDGYKVLNEAAMKSLGFSSINDEYIVNYATGEVINKSQRTTSSGRALYISN